MKKMKHLLGLLATLCLLLSMTVPAALAESDSVVLTYSFFDNTVASGTVKYQGENANKSEVSFTSEPAASYLNTSYATGGVQLANSYFVGGFSKDRAVQDWCALKINNVSTGTYDMTFDLQRSTKAGLFTVFVVAEKDYAGVFKTDEGKEYAQKMQAGTDLTLEENTAILNAVKSKALDKNPQVVLDNGDQNDVPELQSIGMITFPENGNYVLVFRCDGASKNCKTEGKRLLLNSLTMTPVMATVGDEAYTDAASAIAAIKAADAADDVKITGNLQLSSALTTSAAITVADGAVLDLNKQMLTASGVTTLGTGNVIDSSANADGILKVAADKLSLQSTNSQFALYDSVNGGYKFYTATITNNVKTETVDSTTSKYWFRITFSADSAYDLIARGNSGLKINAALSWNGGSKNATPEASFYEGWAPAVKGNENVAISLTVKGVDQVENLTVTASITNTAAIAAQ